MTAGSGVNGLNNEQIPDPELSLTVKTLGEQGCEVVRVLASHQCDRGSNPGAGVISGLNLLLVLFLTPVFLVPQKPTILISILIGNSRVRNLSVERLFSVPSLNKANLVIYLFA